MPPKKSNYSNYTVPSATGKNLVIVESPAKARTVSQILGNEFVVAASMGHVSDLPRKEIGVDIKNNFTPSYYVQDDKKSLVNQLKKSAVGADNIYLATDPDREGEAISWHIKNAAGWGDKPKRVVFHEITRQAVLDAFSRPRRIDMQLVNAQQARRILDRLVGYEISPLLWKRVQKGASAGRVQSVALKMIVDREREIEAFITEEWWTIEVDLCKEGSFDDHSDTFRAILQSELPSLEKLHIPNEQYAESILTNLNGAKYSIVNIQKRPRKQQPAAPFITSTLQQESARKLRFSAQQTMVVAQQLYEGLNIGTEGQVGLITYMRTDSPTIADSAIEEIRIFINNCYEDTYLPDQSRAYKSRSKNAQEAHEAIRPTSINRTPDSISSYLNTDQLKLYKLIWERTLASQMTDALLETTTIDIDADCKNNEPKAYRFRANGSVIMFQGFRIVYLESTDDTDDNQNNALPVLAVYDCLEEIDLESKQHFTQPPPRYTEATLIKTLEEHGIGRPSTYAPIISTITAREYITKDNRRIFPTNTGLMVNDLVTEHFSDIVDLDFTAHMEENLDDIAHGTQDWIPMLEEFYNPFHNKVNEAKKIFSTPELSDETCEKCGSKMAVRVSKFGRFLGCSAYPKCKNIKRTENDQDQDTDTTDEICEKCNRPMTIKTGRYGKFLACTGYEEKKTPCDNRRPIVKSSGVDCPECGNQLIERTSKKTKRSFWGCSGYPKCTFLVNSKPLAEKCPECTSMLVTATNNTSKCINKECGWTGTI